MNQNFEGFSCAHTTNCQKFDQATLSCLLKVEKAQYIILQVQAQNTDQEAEEESSEKILSNKASKARKLLRR